MNERINPFLLSRFFQYSFKVSSEGGEDEVKDPRLHSVQ